MSPAHGRCFKALFLGANLGKKCRPVLSERRTARGRSPCLDRLRWGSMTRPGGGSRGITAMITEGAGTGLAGRCCGSIVVRFERHGFQTVICQLRSSTTKELLTRCME